MSRLQWPTLQSLRAYLLSHRHGIAKGGAYTAPDKTRLMPPESLNGISELGGGLQALVGALDKEVCGERHDVVGQIGDDHVLLGNAWDVGCAGEAHHHLELILQHVHHADDAVHAIGSQGVEDRAAHTHCLCPQSHGLEDVAAAGGRHRR